MHRGSTETRAFARRSIHLEMVRKNRDNWRAICEACIQLDFFPYYLEYFRMFLQRVTPELVW